MFQIRAVGSVPIAENCREHNDAIDRSYQDGELPLSRNINDRVRDQLGAEREARASAKRATALAYHFYAIKQAMLLEAALTSAAYAGQRSRVLMLRSPT